jgi:hypothetical protein
MKNFWKNKPLIVTENDFRYLLNKEQLLDHIQNDIDTNKTYLEYSLNESIDNILTFINENYHKKCSMMTLRYSKELFTYFCGASNICITFYPKGRRDIILGFIMGKPIKVYLGGLEIVTLEVNFLCLVYQLRLLHMSSYMISVLSQICIQKYNIISSIYTTSKQLNTESFSKKEYYHRPLNITKMIQTGILNKSFGTDLVKKVYNSFNYKINTKRTLEYYNNTRVDKNLVDEIKDNITKYNQQHYKIFESLTNINGFFENPAFHSFIIKDTIGNVTDFVTIFKLDTVNNVNKETCRNGYIYSFFFKEDPFDIIERIGEYCSQNDIFDMITIMNVLDVTEKDYYTNKFIKGSGVLHYYFYNANMNSVEPYQNGLVTI